MTPILAILATAFLSLVVIWPLAYFGQKFWKDTVAAEDEKHAKQSGGHH